MTDEKCPLPNERLNALLGDAPNMVLEWRADGSKTLLDLLRQAAIDGYKIGQDDGYRDGRVTSWVEYQLKLDAMAADGPRSPSRPN